MNIAAAVAAVAAVPGLGELVARRLNPSPEVARKLVHAGSGLVAAALPLLVSLHVIAGIALTSAVAMLVVNRFGLLASLRVDRSSQGEIWFPLGIAALALTFPGSYVYGALVLGLADAAAALVGRRFARPGHKSTAGSLAFFAVAFAVGGITPAAALRALVLALVERASGRGTDNLTIPLVAGLIS